MSKLSFNEIVEMDEIQFQEETKKEIKPITVNFKPLEVELHYDCCKRQIVSGEQCYYSQMRDKTRVFVCLQHYGEYQRNLDKQVSEMKQAGLTPTEYLEFIKITVDNNFLLKENMIKPNIADRTLESYLGDFKGIMKLPTEKLYELYKWIVKNQENVRIGKGVNSFYNQSYWFVKIILDERLYAEKFGK